MARYRNFRGRYGGFRTRIVNRYRKSGGARGIAGMSLPYIAGAAIGYMGMLPAAVPQVLVLGAAVSPVRLGVVTKVAQGVVLGQLARNLMSGGQTAPGSTTGW